MAESKEPTFPDDTIGNIEPNPEDTHIMEGPDPSGNNFLDFSQSFSNGPIMDDSIEDDSNIYGDETTNPFGDETTLPDESRDSINMSQYSHGSHGSHGSQGSLHLSDLQGGKRRKKRKTSKRKNKKSTRKNNKNTKKKIKNSKKKTKKNKISKYNNLKKVRKQTRSKK